MHVVVTVSSAEVSARAYTPATTCVLIFVAKDADGRADRRCPRGSPQSRSDHKLAERSARSHRRPAPEIKHLMLDEEYTDALRGAAHDAAVPRAAGRRELRRQGARRHGHALDRRGRLRVRASGGSDGDAASRPRGRGLLGRHPLLRAGADRRPRRGRGADRPTPARTACTSASRVSTADPRAPARLTLTTQCLSVFVVPDAERRRPAGAALGARRFPRTCACTSTSARSSALRETHRADPRFADPRAVARAAHAESHPPLILRTCRRNSRCYDGRRSAALGVG